MHLCKEAAHKEVITMAMVIANNNAAMLTLGEVNKNNSALGKQLKKVSSGMKINSAGDDASGYAISERMRVRIRALDQDERNVQNGAALLRVAEGAIQQQIEIMKTIKAKVIDADNDTNTDLDRATIQKEIDQGYTQIQNIAYETNYNGKLLLVGDTKTEMVSSWAVLPAPIQIPETELNVIPDVYDTLDELFGPFDVFSRFSSGPTTAEPLLGSESSVNLSGGVNAVTEQKEPLTASPATFTLDLSGYTPSQLDGVGFYIPGTKTRGSSSTSFNEYYVLTTDTSKKYRNSDVNKIDISGLSSTAEIAAKIANSIKKGTSYSISTETSWDYGIKNFTTDGAKITFTTTKEGTSANNRTLIWGWSAPESSSTTYVGKTPDTPAKNARTSADNAGITSETVTGKDAVTVYHAAVTHKERDPDTDLEITIVDQEAYWETLAEAKPATVTKNISSAASGSGITITSGSTAYLKFEEGTAGPYQDDEGVWIVGKNATVSDFTLRSWNQTGNPKNGYNIGAKLTMSGGNLTLTTTSVGSSASITIKDGIEADAGSPFIPGNPGTPVVTNYEAVTALDNNTVSKTSGGINKGPVETISEATWASYTMDLTAYDTTDADKLNEFVDAILGKTLSVNYTKYGFIDTTVPTSIEAVQQNGSDVIDVDLKTLRNAVAGGQTIADAFINLMLGTGNTKFSDGSDTGAGTKGLTVTASRAGTSGNYETISIAETKLSQYTIDFKSYFESTNPKIPEDLVGKGFRVYCATCPEQWVNFHFIDGTDPGEETRPPSGSSGADIMTVRIDIISLAHVTDLDSFIEAVRTQGGEIIRKIRKGHPHMLAVAGDVEKGTVTIYDTRNFDVFARASQYPDLQEKGAKIADGIMDDVIKMERGVYVKDLVIQHTDHASQNIHVKIPQTTLDHLFNYIEGAGSISDYNVMTAKSRELLLGNAKGTRRTGGYATKEEKGALDTAMEYLTGANCLVGAQISRLEMTEGNIVISRESTTASESTIRDADMAKEMAEYTKANVLLQASQSMLAQANQNSSQVLSLLQ